MTIFADATTVIVIWLDLRMNFQHGLGWTHGFFNVIPIWTIKPDIFVVKAIVQPYLPLRIPYTTSSFTADAFNKLFLLSLDGTDHNLPSSILCVTLPESSLEDSQ